MASNDGFLTEEQRELLRVASLSRDSVQSLKSPISPRSGQGLHVKPGLVAAKDHAGGAVGKHHDKRSHSAKNGRPNKRAKIGRPNKSGCGGKGTWGGSLDTDGDLHVDCNDPNYDNEEEPHQLVGTTEGWLSPASVKSIPSEQNGPAEHDNARLFKEKAVTIIQEYFLSDDISEVTRSLEDLAVPDFNAAFVKWLIKSAMNRENREKEMASVLLSALYTEVFPVEDIVNGFVLIIHSAEGIAASIVDAAIEVIPHLASLFIEGILFPLAHFLARAVIDDVLAPLNLEEIDSQFKPVSIGRQIVHRARSLLDAHLAGERILSCWVDGTGWAVEDAEDKINKLLEEYEAGGDIGEACQCIRDLNMPFFPDEVVKKALVMAMKKENDRLLNLLQECSSEGLITIIQMMEGFTRVVDSLDDLALDIPNPREKFASYVEYAKVNGWLVSSFTYDAV